MDPPASPGSKDTMASYDLRSFIFCSYKIGTKSILLHQKMAWPSSHHLNLSIYSSTSPCPLPIKSITSIFKLSKISGHLLLRDSKDPVVSSAMPTLKSGSWHVGDAVKSTEDAIAFKKILGHTQIGKAGLGATESKEIPPKQSYEYRKLISSTAKKMEEDVDYSKAIQLQVQGQWTRWTNYVQNNLSWKNILAMPPNFLSFCVASTFDTLPSPSNLKRWRITTESSCFLCQKTICTTAHILGACQIALSQGRFTYRHDLVLNELLKSVKLFIGSLPSNKIVKKSKYISFVKAGQHVSTKKPKHTGVLHLSDDWIVIADISSDFVFPIHIALTSLRPDLVIYSNKLKRVILIELTCPCEENMESWHSAKISRYSSLVKIIESNKWTADLFAVEVGARGYCSRTVPHSLKRLGFNNKLAYQTSKLLAEISRKSSFCIWLARNSKSWLPNADHPKQSKQARFKAPLPVRGPRKTYQVMSSASRKSDQPIHAGFFNKGNTCYVNSILQALSVLPNLWCQYPSETSNISAVVRTFLHNMSQLKRSIDPLDPSDFLKALESEMSVKTGATFNINSQQDAQEVLQILLDELVGSSVLAKDLITTTVRSVITCDTCQFDSVSEESHTVIPTPVCNSINDSFSEFLAPLTLTGNNKWLCPLCNSKQDSTKEMFVSSLGDIIIIHLKRFKVDEKNIPSKNCLPVECFSEPLKVPFRVDDDILLSKSYSLVAIINHSGKLNAGHYTATIREKGSTNWLSCNDKSVLPTDLNKFDYSLPYVLFFTKS